MAGNVSGSAAGNVVRIAGVSGSLRAASYNTALLRAAVEICEQTLPGQATIEIVPIIELPIYNGDVEAVGIPDAVKAFKQAIAGHDAVLFATPEYNSSVSGALKNAIDWGSRGGNVWSGKPVAMMGATMGGTGTAVAQSHLRQILVRAGALTLAQPEAYVATAQSKFDAGLQLTDERTREHLARLLTALVAWTATHTRAG